MSNALGIVQPPSARLDSWKSIAVYLNRSLRTVQRWHERYSLPIHKVGGESGSIFAYSNELDIWMEGRGEEEAPTLQQHDNPSPAHQEQTHLELNRVEAFPQAHQQESSRLVSTAHRMRECLSPGNIEPIVRTYQNAVLLDPLNGDALTGLSLALIMENLLEVVPPSSGYGSARRAMERAMEIEPDRCEIQSSNYLLKMLIDHDWQAARLGFNTILENDGACRYALIGRSLLYIGESRLHDARDLFFRAAELNPLSFLAAAFHIWTEYLAGNFNRAMILIGGARACGHSGVLLDAFEAFVLIQINGPGEQIERFAPRAHQSLCPALLQGILGYAYAATGQGNQAIRLVEGLNGLETRPQGQFAYPVALILTALGDHQSAVEALERSYRRGSLWSFGFLSDPLLASLRTSEYFKQFQSSVAYPASVAS